MKISYDNCAISDENCTIKNSRVGGIFRVAGAQIGGGGGGGQGEKKKKPSVFPPPPPQYQSSPKSCNALEKIKSKYVTCMFY